jgi:hypothetical protein
MKSSRAAITALVAVSAFAWFILLLSAGTPVPLGFFDPLGKIITGVILLLGAFDKWLWRVLPSSIVKRPKIAGTWRVDMQSNWVDPETDNVIPTVNAFLNIRQSFSSIDARLLTPESKSYQLSAQLVPPTNDDEYLLVAVYRNEPKLLIRDRSPIHFGALILRIPSGSPRTLSGQYWTDRKTCGELSGSDRDKKHFSSFAEADAHWVSKESRH